LETAATKGRTRKRNEVFMIILNGVGFGGWIPLRIGVE
jgi:hypothetical protein